jgi:polar amino acid transport system substrate-binding protein
MKRGRFLAVLLLVTVVVGLVASCAPKQEATTKPVDPRPSISAILAKKKIVIGTSSGYFPFEMVNKDGKLIGFDIDMGNKIGEILGVTVEWKDMAEFSALIPALQAGQLDLVIAGMTIRAKRALSVDFTRPYFTTGQGVLINKQKMPNAKTIEDLDKAGVIIAVSQGTTGHNAADRVFKKATVKPMDGSTTAGLEVLAGNAHAMVFDLDWITIYHYDNLAKTNAILEPITVEYLGIAVRPGQPDLVYWLNTFLTEFVGNEEYQAMYDYYFKDMPWKLEMPK